MSSNPADQADIQADEAKTDDIRSEATSAEEAPVRVIEEEDEREANDLPVAEKVGSGAVAVEIVEAEMLADRPPASKPEKVLEESIDVVDETSLPFRLLRNFCLAVEWCFGVACLIAALAVVATAPLLQFISLGYLLESSGRVAREKKLGAGFIGVRKAARVGSVILGTYLFFLPLQLVTDMWYSSALIDSGSRITAGWGVGQMVLTALLLGHIVIAWSAGGKLRHFFWPVLAIPFLAIWGLRKLLALVYKPKLGQGRMSALDRFWTDLTQHQPLTQWFPPAAIIARLHQGDVYTRASDAVWEFTMGMRLPYYFWLGLRGFAVALLWLAIPALLLMGATVFQGAPAIIMGLAGSLTMGVLLFFLPFLQTQMAEKNQFRAGFDLWGVFTAFVRAPVAFWFALTVTLLFAIPLYLLKVEATPRELAWLPSLVFVAFIYPARLLAGWAMARAHRREKPRFFLMPIGAFIGGVPVIVVYIFFVYLSQFVSWIGRWSLLEQHAFLVPVPFLEWLSA